MGDFLRKARDAAVYSAKFTYNIGVGTASVLTGGAIALVPPLVVDEVIQRTSQQPMNSQEFILYACAFGATTLISGLAGLVTSWDLIDKYTYDLRE